MRRRAFVDYGSYVLEATRNRRLRTSTYFIYDVMGDFDIMEQTMRAELSEHPDAREVAWRSMPWLSQLNVQVRWEDDPAPKNVRGFDDRIRDLAVAYDAVLDVREVREY